MRNLSPRADWLYLMRLDDFWASLLLASLPPTSGLTDRRVFLRSRVCYTLLSASPRGYALRFATVAVIGSGWLLSSNKILPMLGTLGRAPWPAIGFSTTGLPETVLGKLGACPKGQGHGGR